MKRGRKPLEERFTDEQKEYIRNNFPNTPNCEMAKVLGISEDSMKVYAHRNHIFKSEEYIKKVRREAGAKAIGLGHQFPKGFKRQFPTKVSEDKWRENISKGLKERWRKERLRVQYGLPQQTKLRVTAMPNKVRLLSTRLRKKGYIIDKENRIAYYNDHTRRCKLAEKRKVWFTFCSVDEMGKNVNDVNDKYQKGNWVPEAMNVNVFFS